MNVDEEGQEVPLELILVRIKKIGNKGGAAGISYPVGPRGASPRPRFLSISKPCLKGGHWIPQVGVVIGVGVKCDHKFVFWNV